MIFKLSKTISGMEGVSQLPAFQHTGNILVNLRGSNGSGKSYCIRKVVSQFHKPIARHVFDMPSEKYGTVKVPVDEYETFYVLGSYDNECGGLDGVRDFYVIAPLVKQLIGTKSILMEGVLWSSVFSAMHRLDRELREMGHASVWCAFQWDCQTHLDRIMERRAKRGVFEPMQLKNVIGKVKSINTGTNHAVYYGSYVLWGDTDYLVPRIVRLLRENTLEGVDFTKEHFFVPDMELYSQKMRDGEMYVPSEALKRQYQSTTNLMDLF
ncbi:hypothetical protein SHAb15599_00164 [Acinetobacter phage SH-Ab 15599]|nr:hypothetical protein SHAb15599_00164 [Acinetobacter phage SH-Ab 15599]